MKIREWRFDEGLSAHRSASLLMMLPSSFRRFPGDSSIAPLSENKGSGPTAENPGNVHPVNDPGAGQYPPESEEHQQGPSIYRSIENPYALKEAMNKLESALDEIIKLFKGEGQTLSKDGDFAEGNAAYVPEYVRLLKLDGRLTCVDVSMIF